jgi:hypothetical protein
VASPLRIAVESLTDLAARFAASVQAKMPPSERPLPGSGEPMAPAAKEGLEPRAQVLPYGYNTAIGPRTGLSTKLTPFDQLRALADFDLVRISIEDAKNQILGMSWEVRVRPEFKGQETRLQSRIAEVRAFCEMPDPLAGLSWPEWCGAVIEEIYVTDALTLLPRMDLGGRLIGLEQIDGATIKPLVDDRGRPPLPPSPAYQQVVRGIVETEFRLGEILYVPRSRRSYTPYGRSTVENILFAANLAIRQQLHELAYYTDGNLPDGGMWSVPETWGPDQIEAAQKKLDDITAGRSDRRSGYVRLMPPGTYVATKDRKWEYEFLEWLGRIISWACGVSPIPIAKQMNRATGEVLEQSSMESGPRPVANHIANVVNRALMFYGGVTEVEFAWADDEVEDPTVVYQRTDTYRKGGIITVNDARQASGLEPYKFDTPPLIDTPSGPQLLEKLIEDLKNPPDPPPGLDHNAPPAPPGEDVPADPPPAEDTDDEEPTAQEKAWHAAFSKYRAAVVVDLRKWKGVIQKRSREGRAQKVFRSTVIPFRIRKAITDQASSPTALQNAIDLFKAELKVTGERRKIERAIEALISGWLGELEPKVLAWALEQLPAEKLRKAADPDFDASDIADDLAAQLEAGASLGAAEAAQAIGINLDRVPDEVITYARLRAGELIGKQYVGGAWVTSTTDSAISETLRAQVKQAISKAIEESWTPQQLSSTLKSYFEVSRAQTIARTETGFAYGNGAAELYKSEGIEQLKVSDGPGCLPFGHDDKAAKSGGDVGVVDVTTEADGQIWTVSQYQGAILGHPNCVRVAVPYLSDDVAAAA